jgi:signal transduction histidine kinase
MLPIRNPYLSALVEIERRLLFCNSVHASYTIVAELVGLRSTASQVFILELEPALSHSPDLVSDPASAPVSDPASTHSASDRAMRSVAAWSAAASSSLDWSAILQETDLASVWGSLWQGEAFWKTSADFSGIEQQVLAPRGVLAILMLPLVVHQQVQGAIGIIHQTNAHPWKAAELEIWQGVALVLAAKLEQLQTQYPVSSVYFETIAQQQTQRLQTMLEFEALLRRITDRVRDSLDEAQILQTAVQELAMGLETYSCDTGRYDLDQGTSTIAYEYIRCTQIPTAQGLVFQLAEYLNIYSQLLRGRYLQFCWIVSPVHPRPLNQPLSVLCCPIIDDQGVIGDIWLYKRADTYFEIESVRLVEQVANQCAIAIRQARLYQAAQAQVRELEQLNCLKDEFLNTVSHELRSPMANIEMAIQMLELLLFQNQPSRTSEVISRNLKATADFRALDHCNASACHSTDCQSPNIETLPNLTSFQQSVRYFRMLQDECSRETNLINDLLDLSRLEAGTEPIVLTTISLQMWIPHVIEPFLERARNQYQQLRVEVSEALPLVSIDLRSLERILTELVHNACKYTPMGEEIRVMADYVSGEAVAVQCDRSKFSWLTPLNSCLPSNSPQLMLQVSNSGVEIPAAELPRIFDKFYRIPKNDLWQCSGTGLGLALVKRLAEHLGAKIWAESRNNQVTFILTLPIDRSASTPAERNQSIETENF